MGQKEILRGLTEVIRESLDREDPIHLELDLRTGLELDSLRMLTLVVKVEDYFSIEFDDEDEAMIETVGDLVGVISKKIAPSPV